MSNILILHGPSQYEVRKAYSLSEFLEENTDHKFPALAELSLIQKGTHINYFSFISNALGQASLNTFVSTKNGSDTISLASYLLSLIDTHDKVAILVCDEIVSSDSCVLAIGYATGKNKVAGSLNFPGYDVPHWYKSCVKNSVSSRADFLSFLKKLK